MTNADLFRVIFRMYSTELWAMPEREFLDWMNTEVEGMDKSISRAQEKDELISRREAIDALSTPHGILYPIRTIGSLPSAQPEKEKARRVLWTGWKGTRYTRYNCPNCKKPVKNDDVYCHRCGQKLMFPHVSWTPYVEGKKQELIVRWDDEVN